jgi:hypothetical protein
VADAAPIKKAQKADTSMGGVSVAAILARRAALANDSEEESDEDWDD